MVEAVAAVAVDPGNVGMRNNSVVPHRFKIGFSTSSLTVWEQVLMDPAA